MIDLSDGKLTIGKFYEVIGFDPNTNDPVKYWHVICDNNKEEGFFTKRFVRVSDMVHEI